jgi:hypothetical protein
VVGFEKRDSLFGFFAVPVLSELMFIMVSLALLLVVDSVLFVVSVFFILTALKALVDCKKPLVEIQ